MLSEYSIYIPSNSCQFLLALAAHLALDPVQEVQGVVLEGCSQEVDALDGCIKVCLHRLDTEIFNVLI